MGLYVLLDNMDVLPDLDDDTLETVIAMYKADIAEYKASTDDAQAHSDCANDQDIVTALEIQLDEIEGQRQLEKDARLAQSIVDAKLTDLPAIAEAAKEEQQAREDRELAIRLAGPGNVPGARVNNLDLHPPYEEVASTPKMAKLAGLYVGERAGRALHPANKDNDPEPEPEFDELLHHECVVCGDKKSYFGVADLICGHHYCRNCLHELFRESFRDESLFPPRCCRQPIDMATIDIFMTKDLKEQFAEKTIEFNTKDKTYCANKQCSTFIKPDSITDDIAHCPKCGISTCVYCKNESHLGRECQEDPAMKSTLALAETKGWQRCGECKTMIEHKYGCWHMHCSCGHQFCFVCGKNWKTCTCPQWDNDRLLERAYQVGEREGRTAPAQIAQLQRELVERHNCDHRERWDKISGGVCDGCSERL